MSDVGAIVDSNLELRDERLECSDCHAELGSRSGEYLEKAIWREQSAMNAGPSMHADPGLFVDRPIVLRQAFCPGCFTVLMTEIVPADEPRFRTKAI